MWMSSGSPSYGTLGYLSVSSGDWALDDWITMSMTFDGSQITGELRNADNEVISTLVREDTRYTSGKAGLRIDTTNFACSEFTVTAPIPEPGTVALLFSALAGLLMVRCKP